MCWGFLCVFSPLTTPNTLLSCRMPSLILGFDTGRMRGLDYSRGFKLWSPEEGGGYGTLSPFLGISLQVRRPSKALAVQTCLKITRPAASQASATCSSRSLGAPCASKRPCCPAPISFLSERTLPATQRESPEGPRSSQVKCLHLPPRKREQREVKR